MTTVQINNFVSVSIVCAITNRTVSVVPMKPIGTVRYGHVYSVVISIAYNVFALE